MRLVWNKLCGIVELLLFFNKYVYVFVFFSYFSYKKIFIRNILSCFEYFGVFVDFLFSGI